MNERRRATAPTSRARHSASPGVIQISASQNQKLQSKKNAANEKSRNQLLPEWPGLSRWLGGRLCRWPARLLQWISFAIIAHRECAECACHLNKLRHLCLARARALNLVSIPPKGRLTSPRNHVIARRNSGLVCHVNEVGRGPSQLGICRDQSVNLRLGDGR